MSTAMTDDDQEALFTPKSLKSQNSFLRSPSNISEISQPIQLNRTFDSSDEESSVVSSNSADVVCTEPLEVGSYEKEEIIPQNAGSTAQTLSSAWSHEDFSSILFVGLFACFGYMVRALTGRFFGADCAEGANAPDDFLRPFFSQICVTNNGYTAQTGGALFIDLPANMVGCFIMGLISASPTHTFPWFRPNHPLQRHRALINGLKIGFCGCLTTFASWNTQMVRMLDGTDTVLGPQIAAALCGYLIGLCGAFSSFLIGRQTHEWLSSLHDNNGINQGPSDLTGRPSDDLQDEEKGTTKAQEQPQPKGSEKPCICFLFLNVNTLPPLLLCVCLTLFLIGAVKYDIQFYKEKVLSSLFAPMGALLRWKLSSLNKPDLPWGTLTANIVASVVSVAMSAIQLRYLSDPTAAPSWVYVIMPAVRSGLAGSLSTVSTWIKELLTLPPARAFWYAIGSLTIAMLLGLAIFSPIVRSE